MPVDFSRSLTRLSIFFIVSVLLGLSVSLPADESGEARAILDSTGVHGGLVVHLGSGNGRLTAALRRTSAYQVHGLDTDVEKVEAAREHIHALGIYGGVSVDLSLIHI